MTERTDGSQSESFEYDLLNRLTTATIGQDETEFAYLSNGNIDFTTLAGQYNYTTEQPHAVKDVEGPTQEMQQSSPITTNTIFTADNKDSVIDNGTYKKVFTYGPGGSRYRMDSWHNNAMESSKIYVGNCEFLYNSEGALTGSRTIIAAPTGVVAVSEVQGENAGVLHYIHTDY
ncbi:MAG: hypothetical protein PHF63_13655, partial [Herbinix sp.]|nr:hypothetical protein [Herbinix sp.]